MGIDEGALRQEICMWGRSMFERGLSSGSSGNLSARLDTGYLVTPTGSCPGFLEPERLSLLDDAGELVSGETPTKELPMHLAVYRARPVAKAIVHLHSTYATALSCLEPLDPNNVLDPVTPYSSMQMGRVAQVGYGPPGTQELADLVGVKAADHAALLLANHGAVVSAATFRAAVFAAEELEETAKLMFVLHAVSRRLLPEAEVERLNRLLVEKSP